MGLTRVDKVQEFLRRISLPQIFLELQKSCECRILPLAVHDGGTGSFREENAMNVPSCGELTIETARLT